MELEEKDMMGVGLSDRSVTKIVKGLNKDKEVNRRDALGARIRAHPC